MLLAVEWTYNFWATNPMLCHLSTTPTQNSCTHQWRTLVTSDRRTAKPTANLAARLCSPIAFANNAERTVTQLSKQAQIFLIDQTSQTRVDVVLVWRRLRERSWRRLHCRVSFLFRRRWSKWQLQYWIKHKTKRVVWTRLFATMSRNE